MGYAGVVVFAVMTIRLIWMIPTARGPVVVVNPFGIRDLRIGDEFLPWDSIAGISAEECGLAAAPACLPRRAPCQHAAHRIAAGR
jgi:hypothetical protein